MTLEPGSVTSVALAWVTSATGAPVPIAVVADPFGLLIELDEANNRRDVALAVQPVRPHEPAREQRRHHVRAGPAAAGRERRGAATVGEPESGRCPVRSSCASSWAIRTPGEPSSARRRCRTSARAGSAIASFAWSPVDVYGQQGLWVVADAGGAVEEYDETDNVGFRPFHAVSLPDLTISSGELVLEPAFPRVGEATTIRVKVRNDGERPSAETGCASSTASPRAVRRWARFCCRRWRPGRWWSGRFPGR